MENENTQLNVTVANFVRLVKSLYGFNLVFPEGTFFDQSLAIQGIEPLICDAIKTCLKEREQQEIDENEQKKEQKKEMTAIDFVEKVKNNKEYKRVAYELILALIHNGFVETMTILPLCGPLYRFFCKQLQDPDHESMRKIVIDSMSDLIKRLNSPLLAKFLEESYISGNSFLQLWESILPDMKNVSGKKIRLISWTVAGSEQRPTRKELMELVRNLNSNDLQKVAINFNIVEVELEHILDGTVDLNMYIPIDFVNDPALLKYALHIVCSGLELGSTFAVRFALIMLELQNPIFEDKALSFLRSSAVVKKWLNREKPDFINPNAILLILSLEKKHGGILTPEEVRFLIPFRIIWLLFQNRRKPFDCEFIAYLDGRFIVQRNDFKCICPKCNQWRSTSIMTPEGCGLCVKTDLDSSNEIHDTVENKSLLTSCTTCTYQYAIASDPKKIGKNKKCHYCRIGTPIDKIPCVKCSKCNRGMIMPDKSNIPSTSEIKCGICSEAANAQRTIISVPLRSLLQENPGLYAHFGLQVFSLKEELSLFKSKTAIKEAPQKLFEGFLLFESKEVLNTPEILKQIEDMLKTEEIYVETCIVCRDDSNKMQPFCLNNNCTAVGCESCIKKWLKVEPGMHLISGKLVCPGCKKYPTGGPAMQNKILKRILNDIQNGKLKLDETHHFAICENYEKEKCYTVEATIEKSCVGPDAMEMTGFKCQKCRQRHNPDGLIKYCPNCKHPTERIDGCDNVLCVPCGYHWCYSCAEFCSKDKVQVTEHCYKVHGTLLDPTVINEPAE